MKATVRERLQETDAALKDTRLELAKIQQQDGEKSRMIAALEAKTIDMRRLEDPKTVLRLQELESLNQELRDTVNTQSTNVTSLSEKLRLKQEESNDLQTQLNEFKSQLDTAHQQFSAVREDKVHYTKRAALEREELRSHLSKAAMQELDDERSKHLNEIQQLNLAQSTVEEKYKETSLQLIMVRHEKERREKENDDATAKIDDLQREVDNKVYRSETGFLHY